MLAWITGAGGLIGNYLVQTAGYYAPVWQVVGLTRGELDLTDAAAVARRFRRDHPDLIIHCAAISRSPECQADPERAHKINVAATATLAELANEIEFVFLSTDLVFNGREGNYDETAAPKP